MRETGAELHLSDPKAVMAMRWVCEHWHTLALHVGTVLLALGGVLLSSWDASVLDEKLIILGHEFPFEVPIKYFDAAPLVFISGIALYLLGTVATLYIKSKQKPLKSELARYRTESAFLHARIEDAEQAAGQLKIKRSKDIFGMVSDYLGHMSIEHLTFTDSERLSLYLHNHDHFKLVGRHSLNAELTKIGRPKISTSEGCLGKAWSNGGSQIYDLPEDEKEWLNELKNVYGINMQDAKALRMKSRSICCIELMEGYQRIGMMVFESSRNGILDINEIKKLVVEHTEFLLQALRRASLDEKIQNADQAGGWYE